jgi:ribonuclease Z
MVEVDYLRAARGFSPQSLNLVVCYWRWHRLPLAADLLRVLCQSHCLIYQRAAYYPAREDFVIDLILLGTGGMMPLPNRWLSSLLVRCEGELTLFDCGEGTQIPWRQSGWGFKRLSTICLSHMHADHVSGLPGILFSVANADRTDSVTIYGPPGTLQVVQGLRVIVPALPFELIVQEMTHGSSAELPGRLHLTVGEAEHRVPCLYYRAWRGRDRRFDAERAQSLGIPIEFWSRLQSGESIDLNGVVIHGEDLLGPSRRGVSFAYVTDTRPVEAMQRHLADVDLLICEATYPTESDLEKAVVHKHLTFSEAALLARNCQAHSLWLTHFSPAVANPGQFLPNATEHFANSTVGYQGLTATLAFSSEPSI